VLCHSIHIQLILLLIQIIHNKQGSYHPVGVVNDCDIWRGWRIEGNGMTLSWFWYSSKSNGEEYKEQKTKNGWKRQYEGISSSYWLREEKRSTANRQRPTRNIMILMEGKGSKRQINGAFGEGKKANNSCVWDNSTVQWYNQFDDGDDRGNNRCEISSLVKQHKFASKRDLIYVWKRRNKKH